MNDEAGTHYNAIIDQMTEGFLFLQSTFGDKARPRIGWHIDPFGHSNAQASLFAQMGFDGFFFARIDYQDYMERMNKSRLEMIWRGSASLGSEVDMFTGVLYNHYGPPPGFCFDERCSDPPIQDDPLLEDYNVQLEVEKFANWTLKQNRSFVGNHIMLTMGSDFQYQNAHQNYKNMDKLIKYVNQHPKLNALYSTPSMYLQAKYELNTSWTLKTDDFLPLASGPFSYWTGFYTSRPSLKAYCRWSNNWLQICKQLEVIAGLKGNASSRVLAAALGLLQHHDAITGTEKQVVAYDYAQRIARGNDICARVIGSALGTLIATEKSTPVPEVDFCFLSNVSICSKTVNRTFFDVVIYNPLARQRRWPVRVPVTEKKIIVYGPDLHSIHPSQITPVTRHSVDVRGKRGTAPYDFVLEATVPPMGFSVYFVRPGPGHTIEEHIVHSSFRDDDADFSISNEHLRLTFDGVTGRLKLVDNLALNISLPLDQQFFWYNSSTGNAENHQASNHYQFRPNSSRTFEVNPGNKATYEVVQGVVVQEVRQTFADWLTQIIRLYPNSTHVELEYTVGPIPFADGLGKEVISHYTTNMATNKMFYTDSNGREMQKRVRDHQDTYKVNVTEPIAGNYYPVNTRIAIQDPKANVQLTVVTDRSHGGSSIDDGCLEIMLHRRILFTSGLGEPLNETGVDGRGLVVRGTHYLIVAPINASGRLHRQLGEETAFAPSIGIMQSTDTLAQWVGSHQATYSALTKELPPNVHVLTLQERNETAILRIENQYAVGEDNELSRSVTVGPLRNMFSAFEVSWVREMTLGANLLKSDEHID